MFHDILSCICQLLLKLLLVYAQYIEKTPECMLEIQPNQKNPVSAAVLCCQKIKYMV